MGGERLEEGAGVGVLGAGEELGGGGLLDHLAGVHHRHAVGHLVDHAHIVGDEDHPGVLAVQLEHQLEDLGLDGDIEGGGGLVGDDELRLEDEAHGDHHALLHAAGELIGIAAHREGRVLDADLLEPGEGLGARAVLGDLRIVDAHGLDDLVANAHERGEGGHRVLEDDANLLAAVGADLGDGQLEEVDALEEDLAAENLGRGRGKQPRNAH